MRRPSRAKFRCMHRQVDYHGTVTYRFLPVQDGTPENSSFWKYTPSGEMTVVWTPKMGVPEYTPGDYYYVDVVPLDEDPERPSTEEWTMEKRCHYRQGSVNFEFQRKAWPRSVFEIQINANETTAADALGFPDDGPWSIELTFAEKSDD